MKEFSTEERIEICRKCPIYAMNQTCNSKLYLNPETNDGSTVPKSGYIRGCGCYIPVKSRNRNNHCTVGKW